jgi:DNA-binding CsgD family transcriptional regulator
MPNIKKIEILHRVGLRPTEISKILGISEIYVNVGLTRIRKRKARRK